MNVTLVAFPFLFAICETLFFTLTPAFAAYFNVIEIDGYTIKSIMISMYAFIFYILSYILGIFIFYNYRCNFKKNKKYYCDDKILILLVIITLIYIIKFNIIDNFYYIRDVTFNREGIGYIYVLYWNILFACIIFFTERKNLLYSLIIFLPLLYITGSKKSFILFFIIIIFNKICNSENKKKEILLMLLSFPFSFIIFSQVSSDDLLNYIISYFDHQIRGGQFLYMLDLISFDLSNLLSQYWSYLPRFLFPEKPFIYGDLYLIDLISQSSLYYGYAPAIPNWGYIYAIFGLPLVLLSNFVDGLVTALLIWKIDIEGNIYAKILSMHLIFGVFIYPSKSHLFLLPIIFFISIFLKNKKL